MQDAKARARELLVHDGTSRWASNAALRPPSHQNAATTQLLTKLRILASTDANDSHNNAAATPATVLTFSQCYAAVLATAASHKKAWLHVPEPPHKTRGLKSRGLLTRRIASREEAFSHNVAPTAGPSHKTRPHQPWPFSHGVALRAGAFSQDGSRVGEIVTTWPRCHGLLAQEAKM